MTKNKFKFFIISFFFFPFFTFGATLSLSPVSAQYREGDRVSVSVVVTTDTPLNAVSGTLKFPSNLFSIESVSKGDSILNFWISEPSFSKASGVIKFEGVSLAGFSGGSGNILKINLRALSSGSANVAFESGQILANDGQGTDITGKLQGAQYTIVKSVKPVVEIKEEKPEDEVKTPTVLLPEVKKLEAPTITLATKEGLPAISGVSKYTKADIIVSFLSETGSKVFITGLSDEKGEFVFVVPQALKHGMYSVVSYVALNNGKEKSDESNVVTLELKEPFNLNIPLLILLFIVTILVVLMLIKGVKKKKSQTYPPSVKKEITQAKTVLRKTFDFLETDVDTFADTDTKLSKRIGEFKKDLKDAEKIIENEIKDIDKQL